MKDFEKYYQAYSGPTHLGNFWHSFFDDKFMKKSVAYNILPLTPSYECYEPNYLKNETPENFRKRRYEHNNADSRHLFFKKIPQYTVSAYILKSEVAETVSVIDELKQLGSSL
ncbi:hypothetical protein [Legionella fairfieldensis]|uniref:hypothetical protein n=1 Tax=Legionella fairfieldensis TaxID=45064 RepID=UPI000AEC7A25|nr:hypothetical protein [Legionella fairfieldensis]